MKRLLTLVAILGLACGATIALDASAGPGEIVDTTVCLTPDQALCHNWHTAYYVDPQGFRWDIRPLFRNACGSVLRDNVSVWIEPGATLFVLFVEPQQGKPKKGAPKRFIRKKYRAVQVDGRLMFKPLITPLPIPLGPVVPGAPYALPH